jgi:hypothetical protein
VAITDRMTAWRRERRVLARVPQAACRLERAESERSWALVSGEQQSPGSRGCAGLPASPIEPGIGPAEMASGPRIVSGLPSTIWLPFRSTTMVREITAKDGL